jgi:hypothetical protein
MMPSTTFITSPIWLFTDLPPEDAAVLTKFADQVASIGDECRRIGRVPEETFKLIDAYGNEGRRVLYRELFGREPPP